MNAGDYKVYMLRCEDGSLYTGITTDVERRFAEHRSGGAKAARYTRAHRVVAVEAVWVAGSRSAASRMERRIKALTHAQKLELTADPGLIERFCPDAAGEHAPSEEASRAETALPAVASGEGTVVLVRDDLDLGKIADSGQCFRWERQHDGSYKIIGGSECIYVEGLGESCFRFGCTEAEFNRIWHSYFDLGTDYNAIRSLIDPDSDPFLWRASESQKGIRILRQDPWEMLVSFIISQNRNIPAIRRSIEALCSIAGELLIDARGLSYFGFPSPEAIASLSQDELLQCKLGYRWKYVQAAANAVLNREIDLEQLEHVEDKAAIDALTGLYGVGVKVASCVALFGLHHTDAFPIDVWMNRVLENEYPHGFPFEAYRPYNGVFQQYLFAHYRNRSNAKSSG